MSDSGREPFGEDFEASKENAKGPVRPGGSPVDRHRLLKLVLRFKWLIVIVVILGCGGGYAAGKFYVAHSYVATSIISFQGHPEVDGVSGRGRHGFQTLIDSIRVPTNLNEVNKRLGTNIPTRMLFNNTQVDYTRGSNIVVISGLGNSAENAARFTNTLVEVYLEYCTKVERDRLNERLATIDQDIEMAHKSLNKARTSYDSFRQEHKIADLTTEQRQAIEAAGDLQAAASLAKADARAEAVRLKQLHSAQRRQRSSAIISERTSSPDQEELSQLRVKLAQARSQLSDTHPRVQALERQVSEFRSNASGRKVVSDRIVGINPAYSRVQESVADSAANREAAREREKTLDELTKSARERVARLSKVEGNASKLLAEVRIAEEHVTNLEARRTKVADVARTPTSGFRVVEEAVPPDVPIRSRQKFMVAATVPTVALGSLLLLLLLVEFRGLRLKTPAEICYWGGAPVIGATTWPRTPDELTDFISEFDDFTPYVGGSTLVVCVDKVDISVGRQVTERLKEAFLLGAQSRSLANNEFTIESASELQDDIVVIQQDGTEIPINMPVAPETALAKVEQAEIFEYTIPQLIGNKPTVELWEGKTTGPQLRRTARISDRVMVLVPAGEVTVLDMRTMEARLGRKRGVGVAVINLDDDFEDLPDRWGDPAEFWYFYRT